MQNNTALDFIVYRNQADFIDEDDGKYVLLGLLEGTELSWHARRAVGGVHEQTQRVQNLQKEKKANREYGSQQDSTSAEALSTQPGSSQDEKSLKEATPAQA